MKTNRKVFLSPKGSIGRKVSSLAILLLGMSFLMSCATTLPVEGPQGKISAKLTLPDGFDPQHDTCMMVILMHGIFSSKDNAPMPVIARTLAKEGIGSVRFDFNGHGHSDGKMEEMTIARELANAQAVWDSVAKVPYVSSIVLLGHSQGGAVASMLAGFLAQENKHPAGLVLLAPGSIIKEATQGGRFFGKTFDPKNPPEYIKCFNIYKLGHDYLVQTQQLDIFGTAAHYQGPVCLIHGANDGIVPLWCSQKYHEIYLHSQLHIIQGENHMFILRGRHVASKIAQFLKTL